jgi:hypothetical protein
MFFLCAFSTERPNHHNDLPLRIIPFARATSHHIHMVSKLLAAEFGVTAAPLGKSVISLSVPGTDASNSAM